MNLAIVIPALNEEKSIENIITRCLSAKEYITSHSIVKSVEITVVSDGSTDNTVAIASGFKDSIKVIVFEKNKGYGAAIKEGWAQSGAELLGFLDADGTCDPLFFSDLCNLLVNENADIALGSRLNENSQMPLIRRIGNTCYSLLLSMVSFQKIKDTASGMRVVRKKSLHRIMPLPDGLHFTPAMSARAILSEDLKIVEKDMPYKEREGRSKLSVMKDGIRFLNIILKMIFLYQPYKILALGAILGFLICGGLMIFPITHYIQFRRVEEWMIYRFVVSDVLGFISWLFLSSAYITRKIVSITLTAGFPKKKISLYSIFNKRIALVLICFTLATGVLLVYNSFVQRLTTGVTYEHWSRFVAMSFLFSTAFVFIVTLIIDYVLNLINERLQYFQSYKESQSLR